MYTVTDVRLDSYQQQCVEYPLGPLCIIAGPGSGKTRTLSHRIQALVARREINEDRVIAITHTTKAAAELKERLESLGITRAYVLTVHALALKQVKRFEPELGGVNKNILANNWSLIQRATEKNLQKSGVAKNKIQDFISEIRSYIDIARASGFGHDTHFMFFQQHPISSVVDESTLSACWRSYETLKEQNSVWDFADILEKAKEQLKDSGVANHVRSSFGGFFVDEYQDIDTSQQDLLDLWLGGRDHITVVGDPDQSIFGFKGGELSFLLNFSQRFPNAETVHLATNYRSTPEIVEWVNLCSIHKLKKLSSARKSSKISPVISGCKTEKEEEHNIVKTLKYWKSGNLRWSDMALIFRYNAIGARMEALLSQEGIPYRSTDGVSFFERKDILEVLRLFGVYARQNPSKEGITLLSDSARELGWSEEDKFETMGPARIRHDGITALLEMVASKYITYSACDLLDTLRQKAKDSYDVPVDAVSLSTIHGAKGLEWKSVIVVGAVDGVMPSSYAKTRKQLEEEKHLFYVALSRAQDNLVVSYSLKRTNNMPTKPSPFLELLQPQHEGLSLLGSEYSFKKAGKNSSSINKAPTKRSCSCGKRLLGAVAISTGCCGGSCLGGDSLERYEKLVLWRSDAGLENDITDKALFCVAVKQSTFGISGLAGKGSVIPASLYKD